MHRRIVYLTALAVLIADQLAKYVVVAKLEFKPAIHVIGTLLQFTVVRNPGAAFSFGTGQTWIFSLFATVVSLWIISIASRFVNRWWAIAAGAVLGGALGNLVDRAFRAPSFMHGHVVDFIRVPHYPVFNLADCAVVIAAIGMTVLSLRGIEYFASETSNDLSASVTQKDSEQS